MKKFLLTCSAVFLIFILAGCDLSQLKPEQADNSNVSTNEAASEKDDSQVKLANPASLNCEKQGGELTMEQRGDQGTYGVCVFEDNRQCEEWALLNGDCPVGGVKVIGYLTDAARYCAITGGEYKIKEGNFKLEQGTCTFTNGKTCDVWDYWRGDCDENTGIEEKISSLNKIESSISESRSNYEIEAVYPQYDAATDKHKNLNQATENLVESEVSSFKTFVEENPAPEELSGLTTSSLQISYDETVIIEESLISLVFDIYNFTAGAAHPNSYSKTINYDLAADQEITLADIFNQDTNFLDILSESCTRELTDKLGEEQLFTDGLKPESTNFENFSLTEDSLIIIFNPYQVAPYAAGQQQVELEYADFSAAIDSTGPVGQLLQ